MTESTSSELYTNSALNPEIPQQQYHLIIIESIPLECEIVSHSRNNHTRGLYDIFIVEPIRIPKSPISASLTRMGKKGKEENLRNDLPLILQLWCRKILCVAIGKNGLDLLCIKRHFINLYLLL
jgi:hypothetical protein